MNISKLLSIMDDRKCDQNDYLFVGCVGMSSWELPIISIGIEEFVPNAPDNPNYNFNEFSFPKGCESIKVLVLMIGSPKTKNRQTLHVSDFKTIISSLPKDMQIVCRWNSNTNGLASGIINFFDGHGYDCREEWTIKEFGNDISVLMI